MAPPRFEARFESTAGEPGGCGGSEETTPARAQVHTDADSSRRTWAMRWATVIRLSAAST